jgi:hypothetical protein
MQRHPLDALSLIAGVLFAGLSITLLTGAVTAGSRHLNLVWAAGAVVLGLALLASGRRATRHAGDHEASPAETSEEIREG